MPAALPGGFQAWLFQWITSVSAHHSVSQLECLECHWYPADPKCFVPRTAVGCPFSAPVVLPPFTSHGWGWRHSFTYISRSSRYRGCYIPSPPQVGQRSRCRCIKPTSLPTNLAEAWHQLQLSADTAFWASRCKVFTETWCLPTASCCCWCLSGEHTLTSCSTSLDSMPLISAKVFRFSFTVKTSNCTLNCGQMPIIPLISSLAPVSESL